MSQESKQPGSGEDKRDAGGSHGHQHHGHDDSGEGKPGAATGIDNWRRSELPFPEKLRLAARNNLIKLRNRTSCCGHHGEPGC